MPSEQDPCSDISPIQYAYFATAGRGAVQAPLNRDKILHKFKPKEPEVTEAPATPPAQLEGTGCRQIIAQFDPVVNNKKLPEAKALP